ETRAEAIKALGMFGANGYGREAAVAIVEAMRGYVYESADEADAKVYNAGTSGLSRIGGEVVPILVEELKKGEKNSRRFVLTALQHFKHRAKDAVPTVREALKDEDRDIRYGAILALEAIDREGSVSAFADALTDDDRGVRGYALNALIFMR